VRLDPSLTAQIGGVVLHNLRWRGRIFDLAIGSRRTTVTLESGPPLPVTTGTGGMREVVAGHSLSLPTGRPDLAPSTEDPLRCAAATADSAQPGAPALAAVDGSPATDWEPASLPASLTVPLHGARRIARATVTWGQSWPPAPEPNVPPPPGPVKTRRATDYVLLGSRNGHRWKPLATVAGRTTGTVDELHFKPTKIRFLRLEETAATEGEPPILEELEASR
jgi:hypothetical protein